MLNKLLNRILDILGMPAELSYRAAIESNYRIDVDVEWGDGNADTYSLGFGDSYFTDSAGNKYPIN